MKISFRQATYDDVNFLLELRKLSMTDHLLAAGIELDDAHHMGRVMEHFHDSKLILLGDKPIGLLKIGHFDNRLHISQFQLLPHTQGQGIGSKVLVALKRGALKKEKDITLYVLKNNPAQSLYLRQGFKILKQDELQYFMCFSQ